jgi:hypothetical protein
MELDIKKFIWAPCAAAVQCSLAETPQYPTPPHLGSSYGSFWSAKIDDISL